MYNRQEWSVVICILLKNKLNTVECPEYCLFLGIITEDGVSVSTGVVTNRASGTLLQVHEQIFQMRP